MTNFKYFWLVTLASISVGSVCQADPEDQARELRKREFIARWSKLLETIGTPDESLPRPCYKCYFPLPNGEWIVVVSATPSERDLDFNAVVTRDSRGRISTSDHLFRAWEDVIEAFSKASIGVHSLESFYERAKPYGLRARGPDINPSSN